MTTPKIDIAISAKASLEVKTEIPAQSTGRLVDALTDIIRPFSEKRGLKADLIRLQRHEVAIEILRRAQSNLENKRLAVQPVPTKALVSILENGSLEEPEEDDLIDRWANLLAAASNEYDTDIITFSKILSEIGRDEALLLKNIYEFPGANKEHFSKRANELLRERTAEITALLRAKAPVEKFVTIFQECFTILGMIEGIAEKENNVRRYNDQYYDQSFRFQILERLFVLQWDGIVTDGNRFHYVALTDLGKKFITRIEN